MFDLRSALAVSLAAGGRDGADGQRQLQLRELQGWSLLQLGVFPGQESALEAMVKPLLGSALPEHAHRPAQGSGRIYRIARDQYWLVTTDRTLAAKLADAVTPEVGTVTPLSHARVRVAVSGAPVRDMLSRVLSIDLDPGVFQIGDAAQTGMHHLGVLVERTGENSYEFYLLRTYAQTLWEWLTDAALPYGYDVEVTQL
jgi:methylglutamate dehydrogenase subunit D